MATKEEILESISNMSVMDLVDLISDIEEKFGVTAAAVAAAPAAVAAGGDAGEAAEAEEKSAYDVVLTAAGDKKVAVIKACLLYTSPSPRDGLLSRMPSSA